MDDADACGEAIDRFNAAALQAAKQRAAVTSPATGFCTDCSEPIERERLAANPDARQCCECAAEEEAERKLRQKRGPRGGA